MFPELSNLLPYINDDVFVESSDEETRLFFSLREHPDIGPTPEKAIYQTPKGQRHPKVISSLTPFSAKAKLYYGKGGAYFDNPLKTYARSNNDKYFSSNGPSIDMLSVEPTGLPCIKIEDIRRKKNGKTLFRSSSSSESLSSHVESKTSEESDLTSEFDYRCLTPSSLTSNKESDDEWLSHDSSLKGNSPSQPSKFIYLSKSQTQFDIMKTKKAEISDDFKLELKNLKAGLMKQQGDFDSNKEICSKDMSVQVPDCSDSDDSISPAVTNCVKPKWPNRLTMYNEAWKLAIRGEVKSCKLRTEMALTHSEEEYLAKVHCLRQGFKVMFQDESVHTWMTETSQSILTGLIKLHDRQHRRNEIEIFSEAFRFVVNFFSDEQRRLSVMDDLELMGIPVPTFYDVVLIYLLMDTFHEIGVTTENIRATLESRRIDGIVRSNVAFMNIMEWAEKRPSRGFKNSSLVIMCDMCSYLQPTISWGILGPPSYLKNACVYFKKETLRYIETLFDFEHVRYTNPEQMAEDLWKITKGCVTNLDEYVKFEQQKNVQFKAKKAKLKIQTT